MKPIIEVSNVSKSYSISHQLEAKPGYNTLKDDFANLIRKPFGGSGRQDLETFWALKNVSFDVGVGEVFGIIGKNGSGKSTLLKILSRIVDPTRGEAILRGRVASLLEVGTGFHPELTGRENIFFNGSMIGMSRQEIKRKFDEIVAFSEIEKFLDTPVKFYSSGMYVRLAFSIAAHLDSEILILDEVLSVGDAGFQQKSLNKILSSIEEGKTVLFVTHGMATVQKLCTRGMLLKDGKIDYIGNVDELTQRYLESVREDTQLSTTGLKWEKKEKIDNAYFIPAKIYIANASGDVVGNVIENNKDYWLHIKGHLKTSSTKFNIGYVIKALDSKSILYVTLSTDQPKVKWPKLSIGMVTFRGKIPGHLLNGGMYSISIISSIHNEKWIFDPNTQNPGIEFAVKSRFKTSPYWIGSREGPIAPHLEWEIV